MRVIITGSHGLIGRALVRRLKAEGHTVRRLVRRAPTSEAEIAWDPSAGTIDAAALEGCDAVVHLGAESIAEGRWTPAKMQRIRESRVDGTRLLSRAIAGLKSKPGVLVSASAIGFYGDRGDRLQDERAPAGRGFLAGVCREWEAACRSTREAGVRVVNLRIGVVLSREGGALEKMLLPFQLGVGGKLGNGKQWMSWVELGDVIEAVRHALTCEELSGPVNVVSPEAATNLQYTKALGRVLSRPTILPVPSVAARLAFGRLADELLLASIRVEPRALLGTGFEFDQPELEGALRHALEPSAS